jgi:hypothetical protein
VGCEQFPSPLEYTNNFCSIGVSISDVHSEWQVMSIFLSIVPTNT